MSKSKGYVTENKRQTMKGMLQLGSFLDELGTAYRELGRALRNPETDMRTLIELADDCNLTFSVQLSTGEDFNEGAPGDE